MKKHLNKVAALIIVMLLIIQAAPLCVSAEGASKYSGTADTSWYTPLGTYFVIDSADKLAGLAELVNNGTSDFEGCSVVLDCDIIWNEGDISTVTDPKVWTPIGTVSTVTGDASADSPDTADSNNRFFRGSFDGQGHNISGLYLNNNAVSWGGLFSVFCGTELKNLSITNSVIAVYGRAGSFAGSLAVGTGSMKLENLYSDSLVDALTEKTNDFSKSGGIIGTVNLNGENSELIFENCLFSGTVEGNSTTRKTGRYCAGVTSVINGKAETAEDASKYKVQFVNCASTAAIISGGKCNAGIASVVKGAEASFSGCVSFLSDETTFVSTGGGMGAIVSGNEGNTATVIKIDNSFYKASGTATSACGTEITGTLSYDKSTAITALSEAAFNTAVFKIEEGQLKLVSLNQKDPGDTTTDTEPVVTTTAEPVVTTTAEPVVTTTAEPVVTTTAEPVVTTTEPIGSNTENDDTDKVTTPDPGLTTDTPEDDKGCGGISALAILFIGLIATTGFAIIKKH